MSCHISNPSRKNWTAVVTIRRPITRVMALVLFSPTAFFMFDARKNKDSEIDITTRIARETVLKP